MNRWSACLSRYRHELHGFGGVSVILALMALVGTIVLQSGFWPKPDWLTVYEYGLLNRLSREPLTFAVLLALVCFDYMKMNYVFRWRIALSTLLSSLGIVLIFALLLQWSIHPLWLCIGYIALIVSFRAVYSLIRCWLFSDRLFDVCVQTIRQHLHF